MSRRLAAALLILLLLPPTWAKAAEDPALRISETQRYCQSAKQCTLVYTRCDSCDCGSAINETFAAAHNQNLEALCAGFEGAHCDMVCPIAKPACVLGLCFMQPNPPY